MEKLTKEEKIEIMENVREIRECCSVFSSALSTVDSIESRMEENLFFGCFQTEMLNHIHEINKIIYNLKK